MGTIVRMLLYLVWLFSAAAVSAGATLKGSHAAQEEEADAAVRAGLVWIEDDAMLAAFKATGVLVPVPEGVGLRIDHTQLDMNRAWVLPCTAALQEDLARDFYEKFYTSFPVSSAVRTVEYQDFLIHIAKNTNAASSKGHRRSTHPTGATFDITKRYMTKAQIDWLAVRLLVLEAAGLIKATEEYSQTVFHVMVIPGYRAKRYELYALLGH